MNQQEYWNNAAEYKVFTTPFQIDLFRQFVSADSRIVDIGCGYGRTLHELESASYRNLKGFDFSEAMLTRGKKIYPSIEFAPMSDNTIPQPDHSVDAVILFAVLTCIISDDDQRHLIQEISRILRPGGIIYVNDFLLNTDDRNKARYRAYEPLYKTYGVFRLEEGAVLRHHDENQIRTLLSAFEERHFEKVTFTTMNGHTSNGFYFIGSKAH